MSNKPLKAEESTSAPRPGKHFNIVPGLTTHALSMMSKQDRLDYVWQLPELTDSMLDLLKQSGFLTGSRIYGNPETAKDVDYIVNVPASVFDGHVIPSIGSAILDYWEPDTMIVLYAHKDGLIYNIICMADYNLMKAWYIATNTMNFLRTATYIRSDPYDKRQYVEFQNIFDFKWARVRLFRALKDICERPQETSMDISTAEAVHTHKCKHCGREAINFSDSSHLIHWKQTGICERCTEELGIKN